MTEPRNRCGGLLDTDATEDYRLRHRIASAPRDASDAVGRLSDEALSRIMVFLAHDCLCSSFEDPNFFLKGASLTPVYLWLSVLLVCRNWHRVAVATKELWAFVPLSRPELTHTILRRSDPAPLTLFHHSSAPFEVGALRLCVAEMSRIRHVRCHTNRSIEYYTDEGSEGFPAPSGPPCAVSLDLTFTMASLATLFIGPCLTRLRLFSVSPKFSIEKILTALQSAPSLVHLELFDILDSDVLPVEKVVQLPALQRLILSESNSRGHSSPALLQSLHLPPRTNISITSMSFARRSSDTDALAKALPVISSIFRAKSLRTCRIRKESQQISMVLRPTTTIELDPEIKIDLWHTIYPDPALLDNPDKLEDAGRTTFTMGVKRSLTDKAFCRALTAALPLSDLSVLALQFLPKSPGDVWQHFTHLTNITHLAASPHPLAYALLQTLVPVSSYSSRAPLFPKLESITLGDVRWNEGLPGPKGSDVPLSKRCRDALQARLTQGVPLRLLDLRGATGVDEAALMALQDSGLAETA